MKDGPWRYSKYDIRLLLITQDGVREVSTRLDFEHVVCNGQERNNYRFDAQHPVVEPSQQIEDGESLVALSEITLDSAGFAHILHILEGIAAEGKSWIDRDSLGRGGRPPGPESALADAAT
ncbi:hypothetical protein ALI144C_00895 [Actinosynnema sp. ALI-1.44]|uniref:hypothetical protein n=1 Tax=Actinosynnema sp. ALI-1.44 TaxID=1933779 RepID=UPI00097CA328|nr:hypothetical protein [Actinosynnema sp. ALI-1.44]ONI91654.1 hypothetical protein ALI144C_00895 [Actinosynnema sp. ALI-1.44]